MELEDVLKQIYNYFKRLREEGELYRKYCKVLETENKYLKNLLQSSNIQYKQLNQLNLSLTF